MRHPHHLPPNVQPMPPTRPGPRTEPEPATPPNAAPPKWERLGYAIAVSALWGISAGCTLGVLQYLFGG